MASRSRSEISRPSLIRLTRPDTFILRSSVASLDSATIFYIPSQYLSVWNDQVGGGVSKGHIDTMGWEQPPDQEASPQSGPPETYDETASMAPPATQETPGRRESHEQWFRESIDEPVIELGGDQEQPLEMNVAGETEARDEINAGQTPPQREAYATESEAERIGSSGRKPGGKKSALSGVAGNGSRGTRPRDGPRLYEVRVKRQYAHSKPVPALARAGFFIGLRLILAPGKRRDRGTIFKRHTYT